MQQITLLPVCAEALHNTLKLKYSCNALCTSYPIFIQLLKYIVTYFTVLHKVIALNVP